MKGALQLRDTMEFADYGDEINAMAGADDALWQEGLSRLARRIEGPAVVHEGPATLTASDVDEMLAREYPMTLEDLAQKIEYVIGREDSYVQAGTAACRDEHLAALADRP